MTYNVLFSGTLNPTRSLHFTSLHFMILETICISCKNAFKYDIRKYFLLKELLTCALWNSIFYHPWLSKHAPSLNCFKTRLDKFCYNQDVLYNFKASFLGTGSRSYLLSDCIVYWATVCTRTHQEMR